MYIAPTSIYFTKRPLRNVGTKEPKVLGTVLQCLMYRYDFSLSESDVADEIYTCGASNGLYPTYRLLPLHPEAPYPLRTQGKLRRL